MWQAAEPLTEERLDLIGTEAVTNMLKLFVVFAGEETVVERLVSDPAVLELLFGPLMTIEPDANGEWDIRRELDEAESEISVSSSNQYSVSSQQFGLYAAGCYLNDDAQRLCFGLKFHF